MKAFKFIVTGGMATVIHMAVAALSIEGGIRSYGIGNALGFFVATSFALLLNTFWSFSDRLSLKLITKYWTVSLVGLSLSYLLGSLAQYLHLGYMVGIVATVLIVPFITYRGHSRWTYKKNQS